MRESGIRGGRRGGTPVTARPARGAGSGPGLVYATGVGESGMPPPTGTAGDPYGNAMAESADGAYKTELVRRRKALPGSEGPGIGDVPVGLVAGTRSARTGPRATGHRNRPKPSIMQAKRRKPPHYKSGKIRPYQSADR